MGLVRTGSGVSGSAAVMAVAFALTAGPCSGGEAPHPPYGHRFRDCVTDEQCAADPEIGSRGPFPPLCIGGMCQLDTSHRCRLDVDCADTVGPQRCVDAFDGSGRYCEPPPRTGSCFAGAGWGYCTATQCMGVPSFCFPDSDPDCSWYSCDEPFCKRRSERLPVECPLLTYREPDLGCSAGAAGAVR